MFCGNCGRKLSESARFCPECGTAVVREGDPPTPAMENTEKMSNAETGAMQAQDLIQDQEQTQTQAQDPVQDQKQTQTQAQNQYQAQNQNMQANQEVINIPIAGYDPRWDYTPIKMWGYFWYNILFAIPLIGLIFILVFSFGGTKKINLRNYARSFFCWLIIGAIVSVILLIILLCVYQTGFKMTYFL